ncbi:MAG: agmatine deiminase family protein [Solirubrobacterales bacterium]
MPAEWEPHEMTLVAWPQREEAWRGTGIEEARRSHAEVVGAIAACRARLRPMPASTRQPGQGRSRVRPRFPSPPHQPR